MNAVIAPASCLQSLQATACAAGDEVGPGRFPEPRRQSRESKESEAERAHRTQRWRGGPHGGVGAGRRRREGLQKGMKKRWGGMDVFSVSTVVLVSRVSVQFSKVYSLGFCGSVSDQVSEQKITQHRGTCQLSSRHYLTYIFTDWCPSDGFNHINQMCFNFPFYFISSQFYQCGDTSVASTVASESPRRIR